MRPATPFFPVAQLAELCGIGRRQFDAILRQAGVRVVRGRRMHFVSLTEFEEKLPALWASVAYFDTLRRALGPVDDA